MPEKEKKQVEYRMLDVELRAEDSDDGKLIVEGYAAKFNVMSEPLGWSEVRETIDPGAFKRSLEEDKQFLHWNHNTDIILGSTAGKTLELSEDEVGLKMRGELADTSWGRDTHALVKRGDVKGMSFGFQILKEEWDETDEKNIKRTLKEVRLFEVSIVPYPAYKQTVVQARSADDALKEYRDAKKSEQPVVDDISEVLKKQDAEFRKIKIKVLTGE